MKPLVTDSLLTLLVDRALDPKRRGLKNQNGHFYFLIVSGSAPVGRLTVFEDFSERPLSLETAG